jgi:hypothetical protein
MCKFTILDVGTRRKWVIASGPGRFTSEEIAHSAHFIGDWVISWAGLEAVEWTKIIPLLEIEPQPSRSQPVAIPTEL